MIRAKTERPARNRMMVVGLLAVLMAVGLMLTAKPAHATTFTVDSSVDGGNGICSVGGCTLREAIVNANNTPGADTINFNIGGTGVKTIAPFSALPPITEAVTINGYSQPGASLNTLAQGTNAKIMIQLDGASTTGGSGLEIVADDVAVQGLAIGRFANGIEIDDVEGLGDPSGVRIEGNFLGTDASGTAARPNRFNGLNLVASGGNVTIGGISPFQRNLISANGANGVNIVPRGNTDVEVEGNLIGTKKDGTTALGNDNDGVNFSASSDNFVGGFSAGAPNTIAFNGGDGVNVVTDDADSNHILRNSIFSNGGLGIDLVGGTENAAGASANDTGDPDSGPNDLQNKPVVTSAKTVGGTTTIQAKLNSTPSDPFVVEFFSNPSGENEGKKFIGNKAVSTNSNGNVTFSFAPSQAVPAGQRVTATATNSVEANTSEFSAPRTVVQ
jgi:CSLREA domain-containing protein